MACGAGAVRFRGSKELHARARYHDRRHGGGGEVRRAGGRHEGAQGHVVHRRDEAIEDSLRFAFEVLTERTMSEGAELEINMVKPRSLCLDCGAEYEHDRFHMVCPECGGYNTKLLAGRELQIDSIEVDLPDD